MPIDRHRAIHNSLTANRRLRRKGLTKRTRNTESGDAAGVHDDEGADAIAGALTDRCGGRAMDVRRSLNYPAIVTASVRCAADGLGARVAASLISRLTNNRYVTSLALLCLFFMCAGSLFLVCLFGRVGLLGDTDSISSN